ncbi:MAG TPA: acyl-CoA carboxylase subunit epsilon [Segeticoccus sp.]|jgi:hypothetical protein|nr:acyl-CoA carboxylase subunit epsilon [Segeticoccus sp.]
MSVDGDDASRPALRIVRGDASPEEVAALVTVLATVGGGEQERPRQVSRWAARERLVGAVPGHGPGQWRASALPC